VVNCDLELLMPLKEPLDRTKMLRTMLKGRVLSLFEYHLSKRCGGEDIETKDQELLELVIRDLGLDYISRRAIRVQKYYMRRCLSMAPNITVQQFVEKLNEHNASHELRHELDLSHCITQSSIFSFGARKCYIGLAFGFPSNWNFKKR
jgi:hypothetical protein